MVAGWYSIINFTIIYIYIVFLIGTLDKSLEYSCQHAELRVIPMSAVYTIKFN